MAKSRSPPLSPEPGSLEFFLARSSKLGAALDLRDQRLGLVFLLDQDVAGAVLGAGGLGLELVVLGLGLGVADRVLLLEVLEQLADQDALARQFHLRACSRPMAAMPLLLGFLREDLAQHHLVARLRLHLGRHLLAGACGLLQQRVDARLGHGLAVDDGDVLRLRGQRQQQRRGQGDECGAHGLGVRLHVMGSFLEWRWPLGGSGAPVWASMRAIREVRCGGFQRSSGACASMASAWMPAGINERRASYTRRWRATRLTAREACAGDAHAEVPAFACAGMPGVQVAVVLHLDRGGLQVPRAAWPRSPRG